MERGAESSIQLTAYKLSDNIPQRCMHGLLPVSVEHAVFRNGKQDAGAAVLSVRMSVARLWRMVWAQDAAEDAGRGPHLPSSGFSKQELRFRWTGPKKQHPKAKSSTQNRQSLLSGIRQARAG